MGETTGISWCKRTWSPWLGCQKVSPACDHCYAESWAKRSGLVDWGPHAERRPTSDDYWKRPLKWEAAAARLWAEWEAADRGLHPNPPLPETVFPSLCDPFDKAVGPALRRRFFDLIRATPHLTWLLLTKRPQMVEKLYGEAHLDPPDGGAGRAWPSNAWLGATVVTQPEADRDVRHLVRAKHALKVPRVFLSIEPMLEAIDLEYPPSLWPNGPARCCGGFECGCMGQPTDPPLIYGVDWVIAGGESGAGARPARAAWFRHLRDVCATYRVPFHFKQWGAWLPFPIQSNCVANDFARDSLKVQTDGKLYRGPQVHTWSDTNDHRVSEVAARVGVQVSGRLLDGVLHDARPEVACG